MCFTGTDVRDCRVRILDNGRRGIRVIDVLLPAGVWYVMAASLVIIRSDLYRRARWHDFWLADPVLVCIDHCRLHGGTCVVYAVSSLRSAAVSMPHCAQRRIFYPCVLQDKRVLG